MTGPRSAPRLVGSVAALGVLVASPWAEAQLRVAAPAVELRGEAPVEIQLDVDAALAEGLRTGDVEVVPIAASESAVDGAGEAEPCSEMECLALRAREAQSPLLVTSSLELIGQMYSASAALVRAEDGEEIASAQERCDVCTRQEALERVEALGVRLRAALPGLVVVTVSPAGARLSMDGAPLEAGRPVLASPGTHTVEAAARGYLPRSISFEVSGAVATAQTLSLESVPAPAGPRPLWVSGWTLGALGVAALVPGLIFWLGEGHLCAIGSAVDDDSDCERLYASSHEGMMLTAAGGATLLAGLTLLIVDMMQRRRAGEGSRRPLALLPGPGSLAVSAAF